MKKTINLYAENTMIHASGNMQETRRYYETIYRQWDSKPQSILLVRTHKQITDDGRKKADKPLTIRR